MVPRPPLVPAPDVRTVWRALIDQHRFGPFRFATNRLRYGQALHRHACDLAIPDQARSNNLSATADV